MWLNLSSISRPGCQSQSRKESTRRGKPLSLPYQGSDTPSPSRTSWSKSGSWPPSSTSLSLASNIIICLIPLRHLSQFSVQKKATTGANSYEVQRTDRQVVPWQEYLHWFYRNLWPQWELSGRLSAPPTLITASLPCA